MRTEDLEHLKTAVMLAFQIFSYFFRTYHKSNFKLEIRHFKSEYVQAIE